MGNNSKLLQFLVRSPFPLLVFIIIPAALVFSIVYHMPLPIRITQKMLLTNNCVLLLLIAIRLWHYLSRLRQAIRYGETAPPAVTALTPGRPAAKVRDEMQKQGFNWNSEGSYAEKRDRGYLGTALIYGGLFLLLFIGTWENLRQFSGTVLHGIGMPADLSQRSSYFPLSRGILSSISGLPKLEVTKQIFASSTYNRGASEITLMPKSGKEPIRTTLVAFGDPYKYQGFDIYLAKQLVDIAFSIKVKNDLERPIFNDSVQFSPLWKKEGDYSMYGTFKTRAGDEGEAFYNPETKKFKFSMTRDGKKVLDTDYVMYQYREKAAGNFVISVNAMGNWSEIHVVRRRHMETLWIGGVIALLGLLLRLAFRPQRVWLEETPEGCRVWGIGGETKKLMKEGL